MRTTMADLKKNRDPSLHENISELDVRINDAADMIVLANTCLDMLAEKRENVSTQEEIENLIQEEADLLDDKRNFEELHASLVDEKFVALMQMIEQLHQRHGLYQQQNDTFNAKLTIVKLLVALSQQAILAVNSELSIGSDNVKGTRRMTSEERTKGWSSILVSSIRQRQIEWVRDDKNKWEIRLNNAVAKQGLKEDELLGAAEKYTIATGVQATIAKAGNCEEMSMLAFVKICNNYGDLMINRHDNFRIQLYSALTFDHTFIKISMNDVSVICDPWLGKTFPCTTQGLETMRDMLFIDLGLESTNKDNQEKFNYNFNQFAHAMIVNDNQYMLRNNNLAKYLDITEPERMNMIAHSYEATLSDARKLQSIQPELEYGKKIPKYKNYEKIKNQEPKNDLEKMLKNAVEKSIMTYEFPVMSSPMDPLPYLDFLEYLALDKNAPAKDSARNIISYVIQNENGRLIKTQNKAEEKVFVETNVMRTLQREKYRYVNVDNEIIAKLIHICEKNEVYSAMIMEYLKPYVIKAEDICVDALKLLRLEKGGIDQSFDVLGVVDVDHRYVSFALSVNSNLLSAMNKYQFPSVINHHDLERALKFLLIISGQPLIQPKESASYVLKTWIAKCSVENMELFKEIILNISKNKSYYAMFRSDIEKYLGKPFEGKAEKLSDSTLIDLVVYKNYLNSAIQNGMMKAPDVMKLDVQLRRELELEFIDEMKKYMFYVNEIDDAQDVLARFDLLYCFATSSVFEINRNAADLIKLSVYESDDADVNSIFDRLIAIAKVNREYENIIKTALGKKYSISNEVEASTLTVDTLKAARENAKMEYEIKMKVREILYKPYLDTRDSALNEDVEALKKIAFSSKYARVLINDELSPYLKSGEDINQDALIMKRYEIHLNRYDEVVPKPPPKIWSQYADDDNQVNSILKEYKFPTELNDINEDYKQVLDLMVFFSSQSGVENRNVETVLAEIITQTDQHCESDIADYVNKLSDNLYLRDYIVDELKSFLDIDAFNTEQFDLRSLIKMVVYENYFTHVAASAYSEPPVRIPEDEHLISIIESKYADYIDDKEFGGAGLYNKIEIDLLNFISSSSQIPINDHAKECFSQCLLKVSRDDMVEQFSKLVSISQKNKHYAEMVVSLIHPFADNVNEISIISLLAKRYSYDRENQNRALIMPMYELYEMISQDERFDANKRFLRVKMEILDDIKHFDWNLEDSSLDDFNRYFNFAVFLSKHRDIQITVPFETLIAVLTCNIYSLEVASALLEIAKQSAEYEHIICNSLSLNAKDVNNVTAADFVIHGYKNYINSLQADDNIFNPMEIYQNLPESLLSSLGELYNQITFNMMLYKEFKKGDPDNILTLISKIDGHERDNFLKYECGDFVLQGYSLLDVILINIHDMGKQNSKMSQWNEIVDSLIALGAKLVHYNSENHFSAFKGQVGVNSTIVALITEHFPLANTSFSNHEQLLQLAMKGQVPSATLNDLRHCNEVTSYNCFVFNEQIFIYTQSQILHIDGRSPLALELYHIFNELPNVEPPYNNIIESPTFDALAKLAAKQLDELITKDPQRVKSLTTRDAIALSRYSTASESLKKQVETRQFILHGTNQPEAHLLPLEKKHTDKRNEDSNKIVPKT